MENKTLIIVVAGIVLLCMIGILFLVISKRKKPHSMDVMEGREFEFYCADLLRMRGFSEVVVTKESGDYGIDILAQREGITYGIQCKCYSYPVGIKAVQEVYAGKDYYDRMIGVVMTNQYFTAPAVKFAQKLKVVLWDRDYIEAMEEEDG